MLFFDRRIRLCEMFENWAEQNEVATTNESFIAWLVINHLVDEEKTNRFISNGGVDNRCSTPSYPQAARVIA